MTCLAASEVHSLIVSGSHDLTCILWDMEELSYITQLAGHTTSISALAINELTVSSVISNCFSHFFFFSWLTVVMLLLFIHHSIRKGGFLMLTACISSFLSKGEIASCAGPQLYLWTMKGQMLTCTDTSCGPQADILCVSFTQRQEWDPRNVIVTGCADGIIRVGNFVIVISDSC